MSPRTFSTIYAWLEHIRNLHKEFALLSVIEFMRKYTKLTKFGILVYKTTDLFRSIRDSNICWECGKIWKFQRGGRVNFGG